MSVVVRKKIFLAFFEVLCHYFDQIDFFLEKLKFRKRLNNQFYADFFKSVLKYVS